MDGFGNPSYGERTIGACGFARIACSYKLVTVPGRWRDRISGEFPLRKFQNKECDRCERQWRQDWRRLVLAALCTGQAALGNGGPFVVKYPSGDPAAKGVLARLDPTLKPAEETRLRVVKEDLTIRFLPEQRWKDDQRRLPPLADVTAAYTIENPTDKEVQVDFGFPILRGIYLRFGMVPYPDVMRPSGQGTGVSHRDLELVDLRDHSPQCRGRHRARHRRRPGIGAARGRRSRGVDRVQAARPDGKRQSTGGNAANGVFATAGDRTGNGDGC